MDSDKSGLVDSAEFSSAALALADGDESLVSSAFASLDSDGDGSINTDELSSMFTANNSVAGMGSMPPPPPPPSSSKEEDTGLSAEQVSSMLEEVSSTDTNLASLLQTVSDNFDAADSDGDGKVTFAEAMTYQQSSDTSSSSSSATDASTLAAAGSMPPPPPPPSSSSSEDDTGYTQDELTAMASEVSSTDSNLASLFETLSKNFDEADSDGDGKVTSSEAKAYQDSQKAASVGASADATSSTSESGTTSDSLIKALFAQMIANYANQSTTATTNSVSFSA